MFRLVILGAATALHLYVFARGASVPAVRLVVPRRAAWAAGAAFWASSTLVLVLLRGRTGALPALLQQAAMNWTGALFLAAVCLVATDLVTGFGWLLPRPAPSARGLALLAGLALAAVALIQGTRAPVVERFEVRLAGLPDAMDGTVVVAIADTHVGPRTDERWLERRISQMQALRPDLIVLLGDILEGHGPPGRHLVPTLAKLSAPLGVFAVRGNHEVSGAGQDGESPFEAAGIRVLRDSRIEVRPGLTLAGIDDPGHAGVAGTDPGVVARTLEGRPPGAAILLRHRPLQAGDAAAAGAGLMLSGHTHGGQLWPLGWLIGRAYSPIDGARVVNGMTLIVSRGAGTWGPRMRLWHPGQILCITLRAGRG